MVKFVKANSEISKQNLTCLFSLNNRPKHNSEHSVAMKICYRFVIFGPGKLRKCSWKVLEKSWNFLGSWCTTPGSIFNQTVITLKDCNVWSTLLVSWFNRPVPCPWVQCRLREHYASDMLWPYLTPMLVDGPVPQWEDNHIFGCFCVP